MAIAAIILTSSGCSNIKGLNMQSTNQAFRDFEQAGWEKPEVCQTYHDAFSSLTNQSVDELLDKAGVASGMHVLDVACGPGYVAVAAVRRGAKATGVDFSPTMVAMAKREHPNIEFRECDADKLPFADESFDVVLNNFGVPHFADPQSATQEAFRVLKRQGRYGFTVWDVPQKTIAFGAVFGAVQALGNMNVELPVGPNFFMFSNPDTCRDYMQQTGFVDIQVKSIPLSLHISDPDMVFEGTFNGTVRAAALLKAQTPEALEKIKQAVQRKISEYVAGDEYVVPMPALITLGTKA
jgi:ubiquinone/menaquinone biosynthesis C-methylase UbiE